jgi:hypothetical protein
MHTLGENQALARPAGDAILLRARRPAFAARASRSLPTEESWMRKLTAIVPLLCLAISACGGKDNSGNAAASKQFTYGPASPADSVQSAALESSLSSMTSLQSAPGVSSATSLVLFSGVTDAMVGADAFSVAAPAVAAQRNALARARSAALYSPTNYGTDFDNPECVTVTNTSVNLSGCKLTVTVTESSNSETVTATVTADGSVTLSNGNQTLTWDLTLAVSVTASGTGGSVSGGGQFHAAGDLTVLAPTATAEGSVKGSMTSEASLHASAGGESISMRVDESLHIDVTYQTSPSTCVTGGTVEAKRVFADWSVPNVSRPSDKGAKITFTSGGCNTGTIQVSI